MPHERATNRDDFTASTRFARGYPDELREVEQRLIERRRAASGCAGEPQVGLALSGGGIRSATFALGVLQALAGRRAHTGERAMSLLSRIDYLSTVSGGGYVGSFLGALFARPELLPSKPESQEARADPGVAASSRAEQVAERLTNCQSRELAWLRENGRYLSPNGAGDAAIAGATLLRNWLSVQVVMATLLIIPFLLLHAALGTLGWLGLEPTEFEVLGSFWTASVWLPIGFSLFVMAVCIAYWLLDVGDRAAFAEFSPRSFAWPLIGLALLSLWLLASAAWLGWPGSQRDRVMALGVVTFTISLAALWWSARAQRVQGDPDIAPWRFLSEQLMTCLIVFGALLVMAFCDAAGRLLYSLDTEHRVVALTCALLTLPLLATAGQRILVLFSGHRKGARIPLPLSLVALLLACCLFLSWLSALSAVVYMLDGLSVRIVSALVSTNQDMPSHAAVVIVNVAGLIGAVLSSFAFSRLQTLTNQSSLSSLYWARLTRAYLGASNPARRSPEHESVTEVVKGDDLAWSDYVPHERGGPLHIVNLTLNETVLGRSQLQQRDRRGMPFALGPSGVSVGVRHHALWGTASRPELVPVDGMPEGEFRVFDRTRDGVLTPEMLPLGRWIALSGAAVSTGVGSRTSFGTSFLCAFLNVRLGHWWWSGTDPTKRAGWKMRRDRVLRWWSRALPVQAQLIGEALARFPGTADPYWYLSDGGHFENTGAYELIRRRVPMIVVVDAGADPEYQLNDLAELVRKARLDFGAEIEVLNEAQLDAALAPDVRAYFGTWQDFKPSDGRQRVYAALARVHYADEAEPTGIMLFLKPGMTGKEPLDILGYAASQSTFPQESTLDQFFDEAQWESYRRLGEHITAAVFAEGSANAWRPSTLDPHRLIRGLATASRTNNPSLQPPGLFRPRTRRLRS